MGTGHYLLLGGGDLAREVVAVLQERAAADGALCAVAVYDDHPDNIAACFESVCLSPKEALQKCPPGLWLALNCVGDPAARASLWGRFRELGYRFATVCSPTATCYTQSLGEGCVVFAGARLAVGCRLGRDVVVNFNAVVGHDAVIGDHSVISPGAQLGGRIDGKERVLYGIGCCVLQGKTIGEGSVIAAGSSVWTDVPPGETVVGVPAVARRIPGRRHDYAEGGRG